MSEESDSLDDQNDGNVYINFTTACRYGTSCYRRNPEHFRQFSHPHLQNDSENVSVKESVEIKLEIGHDSTLKASKTSQGHTHDWTAFVRCTNQSATSFFLEKVDFSFPQNVARPPIVVNQPPFNMTDSGSRSFVLNIDISFKNRPDTRKTRIDYDLYLKDNASFSNVRLVKLVIQNPPSDFRQRLLLAGGVMVQVPDSSIWSSVRQLLPSTSSSPMKRKIDQIAQPSTDEFDAFGQLCTSKLRKLEATSPLQKTLAEKLISEILFHAEQKSLTNDSCFQLTTNIAMSSITDVSAVKTESTDDASSTSFDQVIKSEVDSPSSSAVINQVIKSEVDYPSSSELLNQVIKSEDDSPSSSELLNQVIKSEVEVPSLSSDIDDCVIIQSSKSVTEPLIIQIKDEID